MTQFATWQAVLGTLICLSIIQFLVGSYVEPRLSGNALCISPLIVVFAIFFGTFLWGLFGAFIWVPIALAILTFWELASSNQGLVDRLGGFRQSETEKMAS